MNDYPQFKMTIKFGRSETEQRPVVRTDENGTVWFGYGHRRVDYNEKGEITYVGDWSSPLIWIS